MFSYKINNPNNFIIKYDNCYIIPIGHRCATSLACIYAKIRNFSLPFDWGIPWYPKTVQKILENDFKDFCNFKCHENGYIHNPTYHFGSSHFNKDINILVDSYNRRIKRFNNIINEPKKKYRYNVEMFIGGKEGQLIYYGKPVIYDEGNMHYMIPNEARLRNMNYGVSIHYDVEVEFTIYDPSFKTTKKIRKTRSLKRYDSQTNSECW
jgi:hypothetical protein